MPISDIPILSMLRTRMQWRQERQRLLAEMSPMPIPRITAPTTSHRLISTVC
jgi:hypothetical protein